MFAEEDIATVINKFPNFELCYELISHKTVVGSSVVLAIPEGNKCFAWFTRYKNADTCFVLEITNTKSVSNIQKVTTTFTNKLALGTIFYGTWFSYKSSNHFCIEDVYYYAGRYTNSIPYASKLAILKDIFTNDLSQHALDKCFTIFGLPLMTATGELPQLMTEIPLLPYRVSYIKHRFFEKENSKKIVATKYGTNPGFVSHNFSHNFIAGKSVLKEAVFQIRPDMEPDIYHLFVLKESKAPKEKEGKKRKKEEEKEEEEEEEEKKKKEEEFKKLGVDVSKWKEMYDPTLANNEMLLQNRSFEKETGIKPPLVT